MSTSAQTRSSYFWSVPISLVLLRLRDEASYGAAQARRGGFIPVILGRAIGNTRHPVSSKSYWKTASPSRNGHWIYAFRAMRSRRYEILNFGLESASSILTFKSGGFAISSCHKIHVAYPESMLS